MAAKVDLAPVVADWKRRLEVLAIDGSKLPISVSQDDLRAVIEMHASHPREVVVAKGKLVHAVRTR